MKAQPPTPSHNRTTPRLITCILALLLTSWSGIASPLPLVGGMTVASVITFIGTVAGTVSMFTNLGTYRGDVEEQETKIKVASYYDQCDGLYGGVRWALTRRYWINTSGHPMYEITAICRYADGSTAWEKVHEMFDYYYEYRDYTCTPQPDYWYRVLSRTYLTIGYEVTKPARMVQHFAPNPMPVTIGYGGGPLQTTCGDSPDYAWHESREALAPRRTYLAIPFPRKNLQITGFELTPRLK